MNKKFLGSILVLMSLTALAAKTADVPVTSTISDYDSTGAAFTVQSDGAGAYPNGQLSVVSVLQTSANYAWELDMYSSNSLSGGRNIFLTLSPANQESATATMPAFWSSWGTHLEPARFITHGINCDLEIIKPGSPLACPLLIRFGPELGSNNRTAINYRLDMEPGDVLQEIETQEPLISCNAQNAAGNCIDWSIDSTPPTSESGGVPTNRVIARLVQVAVNGATRTTLGDFYLTFHIRVTNP